MFGNRAERYKFKPDSFRCMQILTLKYSYFNFESISTKSKCIFPYKLQDIVGPTEMFPYILNIVISGTKDKKLISLKLIELKNKIWNAD